MRANEVWAHVRLKSVGREAAISKWAGVQNDLTFWRKKSTTTISIVCSCFLYWRSVRPALSALSVGHARGCENANSSGTPKHLPLFLCDNY